MHSVCVFVMWVCMLYMPCMLFVFVCVCVYALHRQATGSTALGPDIVDKKWSDWRNRRKKKMFPWTLRVSYVCIFAIRGSISGCQVLLFCVCLSLSTYVSLCASVRCAAVVVLQASNMRMDGLHIYVCMVGVTKKTGWCGAQLGWKRNGNW